MILKIDNSQKYGKLQGDFGIQILYPGLALENGDSGIGTIGRIDQAQAHPDTLVPMHPHQDDEILTYLRSGKAKHTDSEGITEIISNTKLMLMNAGKMFYHEELVLPDGGILTGLQIFIRPAKGGLEPLVQFYDFADAYSLNQWRLVAGADDSAPLQFRSETWIYDMRLQSGGEATLPTLPTAVDTCLFYVFDGEVQVNDSLSLSKGESVIIKNEEIAFSAVQTADIVLFALDASSEVYEDGMYSGNQRKKGGG